MRIFATSTMLTLAFYCSGVAGQSDEELFDMQEFSEYPFGNLEPTASSAAAASGIAFANAARCDASEVKKVSSTESGLLDSNLAPGLPIPNGFLFDGCFNPWGSIRGSRRERGDLHPVDGYSSDLVPGLYTDCDKTKVTVKGEGKYGNDTAALTATTTLVSEEARGALTLAVTSTNKNKGYSAPIRIIANVFLVNNGTERRATSIHSYCSKVPSLPANFTCDIDGNEGSDSRQLDYTIVNPTDKSYRSLKAEVTFSNEIETVKFYLPKGSPRIALPGIDGSNKAKGGDKISTKSITLPLASKTLGSKSYLSGSYQWNGFNLTDIPVNTTVTFEVMSGKDTLCKVTF